jgi:cytochrome c biogenesis protein CcdA
MRIQYWILLAASLGYGALGELSYHTARTVHNHLGECIRAASGDPSLWDLYLIAAVFVLSAVALALSTPSWKGWAVAGTTGSFLVGLGLAFVWHEFRMSHGSECAPTTNYQLGYDPYRWLRAVLLFSVGIAIVMAILSLPIGWLARYGRTLLRRMRGGRETGGH